MREKQIKITLVKKKKKKTRICPGSRQCEPTDPRLLLSLQVHTMASPAAGFRLFLFQLSSCTQKRNPRSLQGDTPVLQGLLKSSGSARWGLRARASSRWGGGQNCLCWKSRPQLGRPWRSHRNKTNPFPALPGFLGMKQHLAPLQHPKPLIAG